MNIDSKGPPTNKEIRDTRKFAAQLKREERRNANTRRSRDGTWTKKNSKSYFGFKLHTIQGVENDMTANYAVTTASVHGSQIDLSIPGVVTYKDKGYDATMTKALRGFKLGIRGILRNRRISRKRTLVKYPFSVIKRVFHFSHTLVTLSRRVRVKFMFSCFSYNIFAMRIIESEGQAIEIK